MPTFLTAHRRTSKAATKEGQQSHFYYSSLPSDTCTRSFEKRRPETVELRGPNEAWDPGAIYTVQTHCGKKFHSEEISLARKESKR